MGINEDGEHAEALVKFDKSHTAHVGGQIVHLIATFGGGETGVFLLKIQRQILRVRKSLIPLPRRLPVHGSDAMSVLQQLGDQVSADKATGAGNENSFAHELENRSDRLLTVGEGDTLPRLACHLP